MMTESTNSGMTYQQMLDAARTLFPNCTIEGEEGKWFVSTNVEVVDDMTPFEGTPAYTLYQEFEPGYGTALERWMEKNGDGGTSLHEAAVKFNEETWFQEKVQKQTYESLRKHGYQKIIDAIDTDDWNEMTDIDFRTYDSAQADASRKVRYELSQQK
jgi:hypothetical protein